MDLRPWGSMSTIVTVLFIQHRRFLPRPLAKLLLEAILSDTLNLQSVTTTDADRRAVALLSLYGEVFGGLSEWRRYQEKSAYRL